MQNPIEIEVVTASGGSFVPEQNATVRFVSRGKVTSVDTWPFETLSVTHKHLDKGVYRVKDPADEPGPGECLLVVSLPAKSPVAQRLTLSDKGGVLVAASGWKEDRKGELEKRAATVHIVNYQQKQGKAPPGPADRSRVSVRLFPRTEMVALACKDHLVRQGTTVRFDRFAKARIERLFSEGKLDDGVIFTLFVAVERVTQILVKAKAPARDAWVVIEQRPKDAEDPFHKVDVHKDIGILHFYKHLNDVGRVAPGSVIEAGVFGHAFLFGPLVWDTFDRAPSFTKRDPNDLDGRSKDWVPGGVVDTDYPVLHDAFHAQRGALRVWGCTHMTNVLWGEINGAMNEMRKGTLRDTFFLVNLTTGGHENLTLDHLKRNLAQYVWSQKIKRTMEEGDATGVVAYCGAAAQKLRLPVFTAPPGIGASYGGAGGSLTMFIDPAVGDQDKHQDGSKIYLDYYTREFGSYFVVDDLHYMNYTAMLPVPLPDPGWATERFMVYFDDLRDQQILRLPSGLELYRAPKGPYTDPTKTTWGGVAGHLYAATGAKVDHVEDRGTDRVVMLEPATGEDTGVFVGKNGTAILLRRTAGQTSFTTNTDAVRVDTMKFAGGIRWRVDRQGASNLVNGVLQTALAQWYW